MLRFAGDLRVVGGVVLIESELDHAVVARRLRTTIEELYDLRPDHQVDRAGRAGSRERHLIRVNGAEALARRTGLLDRRGSPVRGLPPALISGELVVAEGVWRGAFMAAGSITGPGRGAALELRCPGPEAALALVGTARRLGVRARTCSRRGIERVTVRDPDAIETLLARMGAPRTAHEWDQLRARTQEQAMSRRLANFDNANNRRSAAAAAVVAVRAERALMILGTDAPPQLAEAGRLRVEHPDASLDELGRLTDPPMTKDAIAGRVRRLLQLADDHAARRGLPDTRNSQRA